MTTKKTVDNLHALVLNKKKLPRSNSTGSTNVNNRGDYSRLFESDESSPKNNHINRTEKSDDTDSGSKEIKKNKKPKKLSNQEIRERLDEIELMQTGLYNTNQLIIQQHNNLNKRMKILEDHLKLTNTRDIDNSSQISGEESMCSLANIIEFMTGQ